jgi:hypothetical protein
MGKAGDALSLGNPAEDAHGWLSLQVNLPDNDGERHSPGPVGPPRRNSYAIIA